MIASLVDYALSNFCNSCNLCDSKIKIELKSKSKSKQILGNPNRKSYNRSSLGNPIIPIILEILGPSAVPSSLRGATGGRVAAPAAGPGPAKWSGPVERLREPSSAVSSACRSVRCAGGS